MTKDQEIARLRDMLSWVTDNTHCLETRKVINKALRDLDDAMAGRAALPAKIVNGKAARRI